MLEKAWKLLERVFFARVPKMTRLLNTMETPGRSSDLKHDLRVLEAYDMTTEAVVAKLMWILGQTRERGRVEQLFYTPVAMDILWPRGADRRRRLHRHVHRAPSPLRRPAGGRAPGSHRLL